MNVKVLNLLKEISALENLADRDALQTNEFMRITERLKKELVGEHLKKYRIYFCNSDQRYHSYLPDPTRPKGRKNIAKKSREELEQEIINFYLAQNQHAEITLENYFPIWLKAKERETNNSAYIKRIYSDWKHYYLNDPIISRPLLSLKPLELKEWSTSKIIELNLTKKQYHNMSIIFRQVYDYLVEHEEIQINPYRQFKISSKLYTPENKKESIKEVFQEDEENEVKSYLLQEFCKNPSNVTPLAVLLNFYLGLRMGELVALQNGDISPDGNYIHIQRTEVSEYPDIQNGNFNQELCIAARTKSEAGNRTLYLVSNAREVISMIQESNRRRNLPCGEKDFLFYNQNGDRLKYWTVSKFYRTLCDDLGIVRKSNHKVRKTCLSKIGDSPDINLKDAIAFSGHKDVTVFLKNYVHSRYSQEKIQADMEKILTN